MFSEVWRRVPNTRYWVSNLGRAKGPSGKVLKPRKGDRYGHQSISIWESGVRRNGFVHRLVAQAFVPNPEGHPWVLHGDGDPTNNRASNLRWGTSQENSADMAKHGTRQRGEMRSQAKLTQAQADEIRGLYQTGDWSLRKLATRFDVCHSTIYRITTDRGW